MVDETKKYKRLKILGDDEIEVMYGRPIFSQEEQVQYFSLSPEEQGTLPKLRTISSRIYFILQLGYFKAQYLFFNFNLQEVQGDARYVQQTYFPDFPFSDSECARGTRRKHKNMILTLFGYRSYGAAERKKLEARAQELIRVCSKPVYIFRELMQLLEQQKIVRPKYSYIQDVIGKVFSYEQHRLINISCNRLTEDTTTALKNLLNNPDGLYEITLLKREPKDFSATEIKSELNRSEQIQALYHTAQSLLSELDISNESVKHYASLVSYYSVFRLHQLDEHIVHIYLLCFIFHRYQRLNDNLITCLLFCVKRYCDEAKQATKERIFEQRVEYNRDLPKAGRVLKLFTDDSISPETPFRELQMKAFGILEAQKLEDIANHISQNNQFDEIAFQWEYIDRMALRFKRRLRPLLRTVTFSSTSQNDSLLEAVQFLKELFQKHRPLTHYYLEDFPRQLIPEKTKRYLHFQKDGEKRMFVDRYEFLVYRSLRERIEAGDIFCKDSIRFRSFEADLIDGQQWQKKDDLLATTGLTVLKEDPQEHLASLKQRLEERLVVVNKRISSGENEHIKLKKKGEETHWSLPYSRADEGVNHLFFDALGQVNIQSVLEFANKHCQFMDAFTHVLHRYTKQEANDIVIIACLIAWGTNVGLGKMGDISDLEYTVLSSTSNNFIRLETLKNANTRVSNVIANLPVFQHYNLGETIHSSSDGQKFETAIHTINARYSPKYFGLKKGVVSYTLVANHIPINAKIIGANEHESHYVFDLLFNNTTEVQPTIHSTDTHGTNEVNFAILHFFGYQFAPRYRNLRATIRTGLYGFKHPSQYGEFLIKPKRKLNERLIINEWENFERIILSLAVKTTTQSIIVGKLNAYARKNRTKRALWEYDNIIRSLYLLDYIDVLCLRRNVQHALNRGENYHKLRRAVSYANFGRLRLKTEYEQQIWNECSRLLTNCIILYNAMLLSEVLSLKKQNGESEQVTLFKRISPVAWQHINFQGRYEFTRHSEPIALSTIVQELAKNLK